MIEWHLEERDINELKDFSKNPRRMTKAQAQALQKSMDTFGYIDEIVINKDDTIIAGHQRRRILRALGHKKIRVKVPDRFLSERAVEELCIRHNKNNGEWDWDILANSFPEEDLIDWGFTEVELQIGKEREQNNADKKVLVSYTLKVPPSIDYTFQAELEKMLMSFQEVEMKRKEPKRGTNG